MKIYVKPETCPDGKEVWTIFKAGRSGTYGIRHSQRAAIDFGREIAEQRKAELIVYRLDGSIRSKDNFGIAEPFPPRKEPNP